MIGFPALLGGDVVAFRWRVFGDPPSRVLIAVAGVFDQLLLGLLEALGLSLSGLRQRSLRLIRGATFGDGL